MKCQGTSVLTLVVVTKVTTVKSSTVGGPSRSMPTAPGTATGMATTVGGTANGESKVTVKMPAAPLATVKPEPAAFVPSALTCPFSTPATMGLTTPELSTMYGGAATDPRPPAAEMTA